MDIIKREENRLDTPRRKKERKKIERVFLKSIVLKKL